VTPRRGKSRSRRRRFTAALVTAKVRRVRFHDLRHTYGTRMAAVGTPIRMLMQWMGHADMQAPCLLRQQQAQAAGERADVQWMSAHATGRADDSLVMFGPCCIAMGILLERVRSLMLRSVSKEMTRPGGVAARSGAPRPGRTSGMVRARHEAERA
jgi:hypothetical protein